MGTENLQTLYSTDKARQNHKKYKQYCREMVHDFDVLPERLNIQKPKVGIVGEILVKFIADG